MVHLDGDEKSPVGTDGEIGNALKYFVLSDFVNFRRIGTKIPIRIDRKMFIGKEDLLTLLDLCRGIASGIIMEKYRLKRPQVCFSFLSVNLWSRNDQRKSFIFVLFL